MLANLLTPVNENFIKSLIEPKFKIIKHRLDKYDDDIKKGLLCYFHGFEDEEATEEGIKEKFNYLKNCSAVEYVLLFKEEWSGDILGFCEVLNNKGNKDGIFITNLCTHPTSQGWGTRFIWYLKNKFDIIYLDVLDYGDEFNQYSNRLRKTVKHHERLIQFYEDKGFEIVDTVEYDEVYKRKYYRMKYDREEYSKTRKFKIGSKTYSLGYFC